MEVSWNGGTTKSSQFQWDFPEQITVHLGVPPWLWKPPDQLVPQTLGKATKHRARGATTGRWGLFEALDTPPVIWCSWFSMENPQSSIVQFPLLLAAGWKYVGHSRPARPRRFLKSFKTICQWVGDMGKVYVVNDRTVYVKTEYFTSKRSV